jgi:uncharacterized membrane protein YdjX (TVP38/TMEM64 family)
VNKRNAFVLFAIAIALCLAVSAAFLWHYREYLEQIDLRGWAVAMAEHGPVQFFFAMSILPAVGIPVSPFCILAGILFPSRVALAGVAFSLSANLAICWLISGKLLRPPFERLVAKFGYSVPKMSHRNMIHTALLLRITPSIPFTLQNYLLGLARMPFRWYMFVSLPLVLTYGVCFIYFGEALLEGDATRVLLALSFLIGLSLAVRVLRDRVKREQPEV